MNLVFEAIAEDQPGPKWRAIYDRHWHAYSRWFMRDGMKARPTYLASLRALRQHMPELLPAYERIAETALANGLIIWPNVGHVEGGSGDILMVAPPFVISEIEIDELVTLLERSISRIV